jgi:hypothetical protein
MFRRLFAPLLAILTLAATATALAADTQSAPLAAAAAMPAIRQPVAADPEASRPGITLLFVLAFASIGGGVGLIAAGRGAAEPSPSA